MKHPRLAIAALAIVFVGLAAVTWHRERSRSVVADFRWLFSRFPDTPSGPPTGPLISPFPPGYMQKVEKITELLESAPTSQPSPADAAELLEQVVHDPDFRIRVRAMLVLPYVREREKAIDALILSIHDRNPESSGGGNVPLYATTCLADMHATRAIPDVADWVDFLETRPQKIPPMVLRKSKEDLARLREAPATAP